MRRQPPIAFLTALATVLTIAAATPAFAFYADPVEVRALVQMPVAVAEVTTYDVPNRDVEYVVSHLNQARVPVRDTVEVIRYTPFDRVIDTYQPPNTVALDLPWDLGNLDMRLLVDTHFSDGLTGSPLADAILSDLIQLGFLNAGADVWPSAPYPVERDFVYYLEPGYRYERTGYFAYDDAPVVVDRDYRVRDRVYDYPVYDYVDRTSYRVNVDRDGYYDDRYDDDRDGDYRDDRGIPPGHAKHDADGPHPTPGHTKHAGPGGPPGHAGDTAVRDTRRPRAQPRTVRPSQGRPAQAAPDRPNKPNKPPNARPQQGGGNAKPGKGPGNGGGNGKPGRGNGNGGGNGKGNGGGNGKGNGKGGGR